MVYRIEFTRQAERQFKALPRNIQTRLKSHIDRLIEDPRPSGAYKLSGKDDLYRIRVGDYRVIYAVQDKALLILVLKVGHRGNVYRRITK
jgi:mRNA interferase RelE/StbE